MEVLADLCHQPTPQWGYPGPNGAFLRDAPSSFNAYRLGVQSMFATCGELATSPIGADNFSAPAILSAVTIVLA